jgi:phosphoenolpyruvate---glycerone phosphotransferase subunit DhaL
VLTAQALATGVDRMVAGIAPIRDALNAADRRLGDGDTGMTIEQVVNAWDAVALDAVADLGEVLVALGRQTARATGSSLGSVLAIGLGAAGRAVSGQSALDGAGMVTALAAAGDAIVTRSGASFGDKTVLDSIAHIRDALAAASDAASLYDVAMQAAEQALDAYREREARIGRARMYGVKSAGFDDPGMLAVVLLLKAARR